MSAVVVGVKGNDGGDHVAEELDITLAISGTSITASEAGVEVGSFPVELDYLSRYCQSGWYVYANQGSNRSWLHINHVQMRRGMEQLGLAEKTYGDPPNYTTWAPDWPASGHLAHQDRPEETMGENEG